MFLCLIGTTIVETGPVLKEPVAMKWGCSAILQGNSTLSMCSVSSKNAFASDRLRLLLEVLLKGYLKKHTVTLKTIYQTVIYIDLFITTRLH